MPNPLRGEASIEIGGATFTLVLDANAFCSAQQVLDKKLLDMVSDFQLEPDDLITLRALFWASLQKHHPCHMIQAGEMLSDAGQPAVRGVIAEVLAAAFGTEEAAEGKQGENPPIETPGIG